jgi:hypothetical protein
MLQVTKPYTPSPSKNLPSLAKISAPRVLFKKKNHFSFKNHH